MKRRKKNQTKQIICLERGLPEDPRTIEFLNGFLNNSFSISKFSRKKNYCYREVHFAITRSIKRIAPNLYIIAPAYSKKEDRDTFFLREDPKKIFFPIAIFYIDQTLKTLQEKIILKRAFSRSRTNLIREVFYFSLFSNDKTDFFSAEILHYANDNFFRLIFAQPYLGENMNDFLQHNRLDNLQKLMLLRAVLSEVAKMHAEDVVHCDLKMRNIIVREYDLPRNIFEVSIIDFGVSGKVGEKIDDYLLDLDNLYFLFPKYLYLNKRKGKVQIFRKEIDIYELAVLFVEMVVLSDDLKRESLYKGKWSIAEPLSWIQNVVNQKIYLILLQMLNIDDKKKLSIVKVIEIFDATINRMMPKTLWGKAKQLPTISAKGANEKLLFGKRSLTLQEIKKKKCPFFQNRKKSSQKGEVTNFKPWKSCPQ